MSTKANSKSAAGTTPGAVAYLRVSTAGQAERGMGLEAQRTRIRAFAEAEHIEIIEFVREAASGAVREGEFSSIEHRPVLRELLNRAEAGEIGALIVASFDRLSRDQTDAAVLKRWFSKFNVQCLSAAGETNGANGPIAELIDRILGSIHDFERKRILERVNAGKAEKKKIGRHVHGRIAYGYLTTSAEPGKLVLDDGEAEVVRRIYAEAKEGRTPGRIARDLNRDGIASPGGAAWGKTTARGIVTNLAYVGERYGVRKAHPAIVSRRVWNAAQKALAARARK